MATKVPVVEGEIGSNNCTGSSIGPLLNWSDANGVSYLAWAWHVGGCGAEPSLIANYGGVPTQTYDQCYHDHFGRATQEAAQPWWPNGGLLTFQLPATRDISQRLACEPPEPTASHRLSAERAAVPVTAARSGNSGLPPWL